MENFSKRTTAIISVCFVFFGVGWGYGWQKVGEASVRRAATSTSNT